MEKKYSKLAQGQNKKFVINKIEHDNQIKAHSRSIANFIASQANKLIIRQQAIPTPQLRESLDLDNDGAFFETMDKLGSRTARRRQTCLSEKGREVTTNTLACMPEQVSKGPLSSSGKRTTVNIRLKTDRPQTCSQSAASNRKRILSIQGLDKRNPKDRFNEDTMSETQSIRKSMKASSRISLNNANLPHLLSEKSSRVSTIMESVKTARTKSSRVTSLLSRKSKTSKRSASSAAGGRSTAAKKNL